MPTTITHTIGISGTRDYTSLSAWKAAQQRDLVVLDEIEAAACYNDGVMTDSLLLCGWTTDTTHFIKIYTPESERHTGTLGTGFHLISGSKYYAIFSYVPNLTIDGLEIEVAALLC